MQYNKVSDANLFQTISFDTRSESVPFYINAVFALFSGWIMELSELSSEPYYKQLHITIFQNIFNRQSVIALSDYLGSGLYLHQYETNEYMDIDMDAKISWL